MTKNKILSQTDYSTATDPIDKSIWRDKTIWRDKSKKITPKSDDTIEIGRGYKDPTAWEAIGHVMKDGNIKHRNDITKTVNKTVNKIKNASKTSNSNLKESTIEQVFRNEIKKKGGMALKFTSQSMNGVPDRLVLMIGGRAAFVEFKAPGKQMRPLQVKRKEQLEAMGFPVFCIDNLEQIEPAIDAIEHWSFGSYKESIGAEIPKLDRNSNTVRNSMKTRSSSLGGDVNAY